MDVIHPRVCGLDVHKETVVACLREQVGAKVKRTIKKFSTTTPELLKLHDWLVENQCPRAIVESTGVYWKPVFNILEGSVDVILANAAHVKGIPGRKTDMRDAEWLAELGAHDLVKRSFIPPPANRELRDLTRYRKSLITNRTAETNRIYKTLEGANIKLGSVASDVVGVSGRLMLRAMIDGERNPEVLAELARGTLRKKIKELVPALTGRFMERHAFLLRQMLDLVDYLNKQIDRLDEEVKRLCAPFEPELDLLHTIPGVGPRSAQVLLAEVGADMSQFPSEHHLASWAGLCPGSNESAGKRRKAKSRKGNRWLRADLAEVAWAAIRTKQSYQGRQYRHLVFQKGKGKNVAQQAVAHSIIVSVWHILKEHVPYRDPPRPAPSKSASDKNRKNLVKQLERLGFNVNLQLREAA